MRLRPTEKRPIKKWKLLVLVVVPLLLAAAVILVIGAKPTPEPKFAFLREIQPVTADLREYGHGMRGVISCGHGVCSDDGPPSITGQWEYTFPADYRRLVSEARAEILSAHGKETQGIGDRRFSLPNGFNVIISPCRFDPKTGNDLNEPGWVRITVYGTVSSGNVEGLRRSIRNVFRPSP
jgi:hypothetical protein